jgi:hypothetical protein
VALTVDDILGAPGSRLYHYTSREGAFEHILPSGTLRLAPFIHMNDPREAMDWTISMVRTSGFAPLDVAADSAEFNAALKRRSKVVCFSEDDISGAVLSALDRGWAHPRMWAQYAGNHTGVCLIFDKRALTTQMSVALAPYGALYEGSVTYSNDPAPAPSPFYVDYRAIAAADVPTAVSAHLASHAGWLFLTKLRDWADEQEYRFVVHSIDDKAILVPFSTQLVGVCVGWKFHDVYTPSLKALCAKLGVPALKADWDNGFPSLSLL